MIRAIIRTEREEAEVNNLEEAGLYAITKMPVMGRGKQKGIQVGAVRYDTLSKLMLMIVVNDKDYAKAVEAVEKGAYTGHAGDGKIFVQEVSKTYTVRSGEDKGK